MFKVFSTSTDAGRPGDAGSPVGPGRSAGYCTYCPKMCRFACPVSVAEARETVTPWGKQTILHEVLRGTVSLDASTARPLWACLECHGCRTYCDHRIDVPASLREGRALALARGFAPPAAVAIRAGFAERERLAARAPVARRPVTAGTRVALFPGCVAATERPGDVDRMARVMDAAPSGPAALVTEYCCGLPLLQAGDADGFDRAARRLARALSGIPTTVVWDPGCLHAMKVLYRERGIEVDTALVHVSEWALPLLGRFRRLDVAGPVLYHDPCRLGRGLGVYDPPRDVLSRILARGISEFPRGRESGWCCGGGGAVPATSPDTARAIAAARLAEAGSGAGGAVVTACPTCRTMLADAASGRWVVKDMVELLGEALL